jgi:hypothetical protein
MIRLAVSNIAWSPDDDEAVAAVLRDRDVSLVEVAPTKRWPDPARATADDATTWRAEWDARVRLTRGYEMHHAEHQLRYGKPREAMVAAGTEYLLRPDAGAIAHYGYILWRNGEADRALGVARAGLSRGFLTADVKLIEALALGSLGRAGEAGETLAEARELNPRIDSASQQYVAFGRD